MDKMQTDFDNIEDVEYFKNILFGITTNNIKKKENIVTPIIIQNDDYELSTEKFYEDEYDTIIVDKKQKLILCINNWEKNKSDFPQAGHGYQTLIWKYDIYKNTYSKNLSFKLYSGSYSSESLRIDKEFGGGNGKTGTFEETNYTLSGFFEMKDYEDGDYLCRIHPKDDNEWWDDEMIEISSSLKSVRPIMLKMLEDFEKKIY